MKPNPLHTPAVLAGARRRLALLLGAGALTATLAGCGGGVSIGVGYVYDGYYDDLGPSVSLATAQTNVFAGQPVDLVAAAADESGIDSVAFYRLDGNTAVLLGADGYAPFEWQTLAPTDGRTRMLLFATAMDRAGNRTNSEVVQVIVTP
jgi:hypothetical protein